MSTWKTQLNFVPIPSLLSTKSEELLYAIESDLLDKKMEKIEHLWLLEGAQRILSKQQEDGAWKYPGENKIFAFKKITIN